VNFLYSVTECATEKLAATLVLKKNCLDGHNREMKCIM